ncbi:unnamed protein product [Ceutorhynchus assimilis]|uniref:Uncharacterized protein n=1 Tax=Ceutorhynchus assimilis TaxID=467358 RepID=A0A9N9MQJ1_9CUCU|nr:unnamed protein product [Ceutorhynchus assimilis]
MLFDQKRFRTASYPERLNLELPNLCYNYNHQSSNARTFQTNMLEFEGRLNTEIILVSDRNSCIQNDLQRTRESLEELKVLNRNLKVSIEVLEKENDILSKETKRLRREGFEKEQCDEIKNYREDISKLNAEIVQLSESNSHIQNDLQWTRKDLQELNILNNNLKVSIEALEKENDMLAKCLRREVFELKNSPHPIAHIKSTPPRNKILIIWQRDLGILWIIV